MFENFSINYLYHVHVCACTCSLCNLHVHLYNMKWFYFISYFITLLHLGCGSLPLDPYPVTILLSFLIFVEGCVRIDTVARQPIDRLTYQITGNIISLLQSTHNNMALSAVCDLIFRVTLSPRQLTVSDQSYYSVIIMYMYIAF